MNILIVGGGGREHAIAVQLSKSSHQPTLFFAPGNPGMALLGQRLDINADDIQGLLIFAKKEYIDLTVVGPEVPLAMGIVDQFEAAGLLIFGPRQQGAQLEASKAFSKALMQKHHIPTAGYQHCQDKPSALDALTKFHPPYVIKEDGLAAGKGVTIAQNLAEAQLAIELAFSKKTTVVIEEFMRGVELSVLAICDGKRALPLVSAQDFKKIYDGDTGPNTGGMGAYAPVPLATSSLMSIIQETILNPMMAVFAAERIDYRGILYAGLMIDEANHPRVVEFNVRFGDPETQVVLPLLKDDLVDLMTAAAQGDLSAYAEKGVQFSGQCAVTVVLASAGYPGVFEKSKVITLPIISQSNPDQKQYVFHAGTRKQPGGEIVSTGGRVLNVTGLGGTLQEARKQAYQMAAAIQFDNKYYRHDIAEKPSEPLFSGIS